MSFALFVIVVGHEILKEFLRMHSFLGSCIFDQWSLFLIVSDLAQGDVFCLALWGGRINLSLLEFYPMSAKTKIIVINRELVELK